MMQTSRLIQNPLSRSTSNTYRNHKNLAVGGQPPMQTKSSHVVTPLSAGVGQNRAGICLKTGTAPYS